MFGLRTAASVARDGCGVNASAQHTFPAAARMQRLAAGRRGRRGFCAGLARRAARACPVLGDVGTSGINVIFLTLAGISGGLTSLASAMPDILGTPLAPVRDRSESERERVMTDRILDEHERSAISFATRSAAPERPELGPPVSRLAQLCRDLAVQAEQRRRVRAIALGQAFDASSPPGA